MKRNYLIFFFCLVLTPFSSLCAQDIGKPFIVQVRTDKGKVPMAFHTRGSEYGCFVGYQEYNRPAIPIETKGEIFIPDSVLTPDGQRLPVRWISRGSFQDCQNITKVHLPHAIEYISDLAFQNCKSLREITLSDSLRHIYPQAFMGCNALQRVILRSPHPPRTYAEGTFEEGLLNTTTVVFPSVSAKKNWEYSDFSHFRYHAELIPTYPKR
ncbi:MAG: leucine-rich repeat protein [Bacteroidaceae bacterium]|nr:leucine-rich repeat protein [Bacteroidaceae bacterium]